MSTRSAPRIENVEVARRIWSATAEGDARALQRVLAKDVVWRNYGDNPLAGVFHGNDQVVAQLADFADRVDDVRFSLRDVYASGAGAVIGYDLWACKGERTIEVEMLLRLRIRDGRVAEGDVVPMNQAALDAFLSPLH